jgi:hypothetical protein
MLEEYETEKQKTREKHVNLHYIGGLVEEFVEDQMGLEKGTKDEIMCQVFLSFGKLVINIKSPECRSMDKCEWVEFGDELAKLISKNRQLFYLERLAVVYASRTSVMIEEL